MDLRRKLEISIAGFLIIVIGIGFLCVSVLEEVYVKYAFTLLGIISGAIFSLLLTSLFDVVRRPVLRVEFGKIEANPMSGQPTGIRYLETLFIKVINQELPRRYNWIVSRNPAQRCYGKITFFERTQNGYRRVRTTMTARWRSMPQPTPFLSYCSTMIDSDLGIRHLSEQVYDPWRYEPLGQEPEQRMDIFAGQLPAKELDLVCRWTDARHYCFGFNNEFYLPVELAYLGYKQVWILWRSFYLVKLVVYSSTPAVVFFFELRNHGNNFNLLPCDTPKRLTDAQRAP